MNSIGNKFKVSLIGSSHGNLVGCVIDGIPAGESINLDEINKELKYRRPGQSNITTERKEEDELIIEAGLLDGKTTGEPFVAFVRNKDVDSSYYEDIKDTPRPGHADYPSYVKYKGANDYRGGGRFSGRMTIGIVIAGSIAKQIMRKKDIKIISYTKEIAGIKSDPSKLNIDENIIYADTNTIRAADSNIIEPITKKILELKAQGDSCGGIIECQILNLPVGTGEPWFDSIESKISHMIFSIPAVKGIEFGSGFHAAMMKGSEHNDQFKVDNDGNIVTLTNNAGGILGGLANGMPVVFRVAFKPTSSIKKDQVTVNIKDKTETELHVRGRHDPCIVPRAVPVVNNAAAIVIFDLMLEGGFYD